MASAVLPTRRGVAPGRGVVVPRPISATRPAASGACAAPRIARDGNVDRTAAATEGPAAIVPRAKPATPRPGNVRASGSATPRAVPRAVAPTASASRAPPSKRVGRTAKRA
jgi:hypothetical protein